MRSPLLQTLIALSIRGAIKTICACIILGHAVLSCAASQPGRPIGVSSERKPNIIFILTDDLGYGDLGCYGQKRIKTPNLDRMAVDGMRFTQAYAGGAVCAPSRCVLMTGLHGGHARVR